MPEFVDTALKEIDERLHALKDEASRLEAARAALTGARRRSGRPAADGTGRARARSASHANGRAAAPRARRNARSAPERARRSGNTRATQTLELVSSRPGITIPEIAQAMKIQPNYLYRVLPRLAAEGQVNRDGQGWHPATAPTSPSPTAPPRRRSETAASQPSASAPGTSRRRRARSNSAANGRTARGATTASVLAALVGGEAMTAGQLAAKAGLARPTVSTTLSKLAKAGKVQKAERGYRLASATQPQG
jgi:DNA-binding IscR family transcriptional regulator